MPLSHARRPLVLAAVSYVLLLALLACWGAFAPEPERRRSERRSVVGVVSSSCVETAVGERLTLDSAEGRLEVRLAKGSCGRLSPLPGRRFRAEGLLRPPRRALMPGEFDEEALYSARGVSSILHARRLELLDARIPWTWAPQAAAERVRLSAHRAFRRLLAPDDARLLEGFLFGNKGGLDPRLLAQVRDAGAMHLLVASGSNVGFVVWSLVWLLSRAGLRRRAALLGALPAGGFYCLMAGGESSHVRAYLAGASGLVSAFVPGRDAGGLHGLAVAALLLLLISPTTLFTAGFQMTFAASLALWLTARRWKPRAGPAWARAGIGVLGVSIAVHLALWPFFANLFGRGSVVGVLSNVVLVPSSGAFLAGGALLWALSPFDGPATAAAWAMTGALSAFKGACAFFASLPCAAVDLAPMSQGAILVWYAVVLALLLLPDVRRAAPFALAALGLGAFQFARARAEGPRLELCLMGDRRGWAIWAGLPGGENLLIDAGLPPSKLKAALRELGAAKVRAAFVTSREASASRGLKRPIVAAQEWFLAPRVKPPQGTASAPLGPGFQRTFGEVELSVPLAAMPGRRMPLALGFRRFYLRFSEIPGLLYLGRSTEAPVEFCILQNPAVVAPPECGPAGIRGVGSEGAVWIVSDGDSYKIQSAEAVRPLGRPLL